MLVVLSYRLSKSEATVKDATMLAFSLTSVKQKVTLQRRYLHPACYFYVDCKYYDQFYPVWSK